MTGDRLTLRDADERRRWAREHDAFLAPRRAGLSVDEDLGARADAWADSRVRAYRERLPEATVDAPNTGGRYGTHLVLPPGWTLGTTPAGEWRVTDTGEAVDLTGPDAEGLARSAWNHWARAECCPTEGASDAVNVEGLLEAIGAIERHAKHIKANADDGRVWDSSKRLKKLAGRARRAVTGRRRPSTGEASPEPSVPRRLVVRARENLKSVGLIAAANAVDGILSDADHGLIRPCAGCSYDCTRCDRTRSPASPDPRATPAAYVASAVHNKKRAKAAEAKLGALIGSVETLGRDMRGYRDLDMDVRSPTIAAWCAEVRDALAAAKGDAPTVTPSPTTCVCEFAVTRDDDGYRRAVAGHGYIRSGAPSGPGTPGEDFAADMDGAEIRLERCPTCTAKGVPPAPDPQVPDSPGWYWLNAPASATGDGWRPVHVRRHGDGLRFSYLDEHHYVLNHEEMFEWGGRCTRGAPDDGLRARVEAAHARWLEGSLPLRDFAKDIREALDA